MSDQQEFQYGTYDPQTHAQPPPTSLRMPDGLAPPQGPQARPAVPPLPPRRPLAHAIDEVGDREEVRPALIEMARAVSRITATRSLAFVAVITASGIWSYCAYDPTQLRIVASSAFSVLGVAPLIWLYWRKG